MHAVNHLCTPLNTDRKEVDMDDDKTIIMSPLSDLGPVKGFQLDNIDENSLEVSLIGLQAKQLDHLLFSESFTIGRAQDNDISIPDVEVSRYHIQITRADDSWLIEDLKSKNGSFANDEKINTVVLTTPCELRLGNSEIHILIKEYTVDTKIDAQLQLSLDDDLTQIVSDKSRTLNSATKLPSKEEVFKRYLSDDNDNQAGEYTQIVREVIKADNQKRVRKYNSLILGVVVLLLGAIAFAFFQQNKISNSKELAINIFYDIKTLEVDLAGAEIELEKIKNTTLLLEIEKKRKTLKRMRQHYAEYVEELGIINLSKPSKNKIDDLILKVARSFGERDINLPKGFIQETKKYIRYWQSSPRMKKAIKRLYKQGHDKIILEALKKEGLPPQFLFLAMQESNFNVRAIGTRTRWGIAKGTWQFIPSTARDYGLKIGPLEEDQIFDSADERHDIVKSTKAATKYLKYIYSTEAQASGLLVMASYNWGDNRVKKLIKKMPNNPRERNFWELIQTYNIPEETYNYVFYIFSAAVIAEDPVYFGFKFSSPIS